MTTMQQAVVAAEERAARETARAVEHEAAEERAAREALEALEAAREKVAANNSATAREAVRQAALEYEVAAEAVKNAARETKAAAAEWREWVVARALATLALWEETWEAGGGGGAGRGGG